MKNAAKIKREKIAVFVENLRFECIIGVLDFERERAQEVAVSAKFVAGEFVDYAGVCADFRREFAQRKFEFVEDALGFFAAFFAAKFPTLRRLKIRVVKPQIIAGAQVGAQGSWKFKAAGKAGKNRAKNVAKNWAENGENHAENGAKCGENLSQISVKNGAILSQNPAQIPAKNPAKIGENLVKNPAKTPAKFEFGDKSGAKSHAKKKKK